jgi:acetolactate synthase small subunit
MQWMLLVTARAGARAHARVLQVLDNQRVVPLSFAVADGPEPSTIHIFVDIDESRVGRMQELLRRIPAVLRVEGFAPAAGICRTVALLEITCDMLTRLPVLQTAAALGLRVVGLDSGSAVVEIAGSCDEVARLAEIFSQHGVLTTVAKTTLGIPWRGDFTPNPK